VADNDDEIATLDWAALASVEPAPKQFVIPKFAPAGEVTLFTGPGSAGKSLGTAGGYRPCRWPSHAGP
jgi:hypothetical protein